MRKVEILAPAGSFESMKAAVNAGADAVYIGGSRFGARAFADNLTEDTMLEAIDYMHLHGKKLYMTVNTLLKEEELTEELCSYMKPYYKNGLDAAIVQDLGVASLLKETFPKMDLHASTQMTITAEKSAVFLKDYGFSRVVPARELSIQEIKKLRENTDLELECFVHGALCYCYSGQCLLSSMNGGRSGNRGRCAQPCRMKYEMPEQKKEGYLLSPKDMRTLELIPKLVEAGVDSFKIEGRMKRPEYTALCTHLYGKYLDLYLEKGQEGFERFRKDHAKEFEQDSLMLEDIYNRGGFSAGYWENYHGRRMMSMQRPNHFGVKAGTVTGVKNNQATFVTEKDINAQDVLEFRTKAQQPVYDYTTGSAVKKGKSVTANFMRNKKITVGMEVYRTKNQQLLTDVYEKFLKEDKKLPIRGYFTGETGKKACLTLMFKDKSVEIYGDMIEPAKNQPMTWDKAEKAIGKINDTKFVFEKLDGFMSEDAFIPVGALKQLRRNALEQLEKKILANYHREEIYIESFKNEKEKIIKEFAVTNENILKEMKAAKDNDTEDKNASYEFHCMVQTMEQLKAVLSEKRVSRIYIMPDRMQEEEQRKAIALIRDAGCECIYSLPYVVRENNQKQIAGLISENVDGFLIRNLEEAVTLLEMKKNHTLVFEQKLILDTGMYTFNRKAYAFWKALGIMEATLPVELNAKELKVRADKGDTLLVYGHLPVMISAQCVLDNTVGCKKEPGYQKLQKQKDKKYYVFHSCKNCYNILYEGEAFSLLEEKEEIDKLNVNKLRLDFTVESEKETKEILMHFTDTFLDGKKGITIKNTNKGHFYYGVE